MSGHNKWSKIKHKKAATDAERSKLFSKHAAMITIEAKKSQGDLNSPGLMAAFERAKKDSMPKENIERAVAKGMGIGSGNLQEVIFETFGPGGVAMLILATTDNNNRTSQEIKHLLTKSGFALGSPGSASWAFSKSANGYTPLSPQTLTPPDAKKLEELINSLEAHADVDVIYTTATNTETS